MELCALAWTRDRLGSASRKGALAVGWKFGDGFSPRIAGNFGGRKLAYCPHVNVMWDGRGGFPALGAWFASVAPATFHA
jgi:hypothetical protein